MEPYEEIFHFTNDCLKRMGEHGLTMVKFYDEYITLSWRGHRIFHAEQKGNWWDMVHGAIITFQYMVTTHIIRAPVFTDNVQHRLLELS